MTVVRVLPALVSSLALAASSAVADLSVTACPGNPGATANAGMLDCAGGRQLSLLVSTITPVAIADLRGVEFDLYATVDGDLSTTATFWDFDGANHAGWRADRGRPASGCDDYLAPFSGPGTSGYWGGVSHTGGVLHLQLGCFRDVPVAVTAGAGIFVAQVVLDVGTAAEAGGTLAGCTRGVCFELPQGALSLIAGGDVPLETAAVATAFSNAVAVNGGAGAGCATVPVVRRTWGRLKSLYR
jgi:hypothetical protein